MTPARVTFRCAWCDALLAVPLTGMVAGRLAWQAAWEDASRVGWGWAETGPPDAEPERHRACPDCRHQPGETSQ